MARLRLKKHMTLDFLGKEWEGAYLDFYGLSAADIEKNSSIDLDRENPDPKKASAAFNEMLAMLEDKFISGMIPTEDGKLEAIKKEEFKTLDMEIIGEAIAFLSQGSTRDLPTGSSQPSQQQPNSEEQPETPSKQ